MKIISRTEAKRAGLNRYFTGKSCPHGHISERRVNGCICVVCSDNDRRARADYHAQYRVEHRDKALIFNREYYYQNAEKFRLYAKQYRIDNSEEVRQKDRERSSSASRKAARKTHYAKHADKIRQRENLRYRREADRIKKRVQQYRVDNPDKVRESAKPGLVAARARKRNAEGKFTKHDVNRMLSEQSFACVACGIDITKNYQIDHIMPLSRGGSNWPGNLQLLCPACNQSKGAKTMEEWLAWKIAA